MKHIERLKLFSENSVGLKRGDVTLFPYNPRWKRLFSDEAHLIYDQVRIEELRLYHCGSTSIPGIAAKPLIDIVGSVPSLTELDNKKQLLEEIGYEYKGEYGIPGRRYSVLYDSQKQIGHVHLHLFAHDDPEVEKHLVFRDYLRANATSAKDYEADKLRLIKSNTPRSTYSESKGAKISEIIAAAQEWKKSPQSIICIASSAAGGKNTLSFVRETFHHTNLKIIDLNERQISPYRYDGVYPESDQFPILVEQMISSDLVVIATPVYWYSMSSSMKNFFDRFSNLLRGTHKPLGEALYGKKICLFSTGSDKRLPFGFEVPFSSTAIYLGMDYLGAKYKAVDS
jgi:GrpB-like predicted nucleotidyltransferase (UPF0157 family)